MDIIYFSSRLKHCMFLATERKEASEIGAKSGRILRQENCKISVSTLRVLKCGITRKITRVLCCELFLIVCCVLRAIPGC